MFYLIAGMMVILAILLVIENRKSPNFNGFCAVSVWLTFLGVFAWYVGTLMD
jgi:predicted membrane channel-forming protein YqfA (hemolysin III family)